MNQRIDSDEMWRPPIHRLRERWYVLVAAGILGGLIGLGFGMAREPQFESEAIIGVNINYGITRPLELVVEYRVLARVATIVVADSTLEQLLSNLSNDLRAQEGFADPKDIRAKLRLDRRLGEWGLVAIDNDPEVATEIANAWEDAAIDALDKAMEHAWRAAALMAGPFDVECAVTKENGLSTWNCQTKQLELDEEAFRGSLQTESSLSRGIPPIISYEPIQSASLPHAPVIWDRRELVLAGSLFGFLAGLVVVLTPRFGSGRSDSADLVS